MIGDIYKLIEVLYTNQMIYLQMFFLRGANELNELVQSGPN